MQVLDVVRLALAFGVCLIVAGCGSSSASRATRYTPAQARIPACAHAGRAIPLPAGFPKDFPLPRRSAITAWKKVYPGVEIDGYIPAGTFDTTVKDFSNALARAGYAAVEQDAEPPREAEALVTGNGYAGHWRLHTLPCPGAMSIQISMQGSA